MKIKEMRNRLRFTQSDLAEQLGTTQQTIARWENGKTEVTASQLKALSIALACSVSDLLGREMPTEELRRSSFAVSEHDTPFGTLCLNVEDTIYKYPIDETNKASLMNSLAQKEVIRAKDENEFWLIVNALDNKMLLINPMYLSGLELVSDDVMQMPFFANPEVYQALSSWGEEEIDPLFRIRCDEAIEALGLDAELGISMDLLGVVFGDGSRASYVLTDEASVGIYELETYRSPAPNSFILVEEEGEHVAKYVNLSKVALIEVPAECYLRTNAMDEV